MNRANLESLLIQVSKGNIDIESAMIQLDALSQDEKKQSSSDASSQNTSSDLCLDLDRKKRCGFPEAIYSPGKKSELIVQAFTELHREGNHALATRATTEQMEHVRDCFPGVIVNEEAKTLRLMANVGHLSIDESSEDEKKQAQPLILTAGSTDRPIAEEAAETLRWMERDPVLIFDVGVAGPQRLLQHLEQLQQADVIIVVAGMEGALPSVVGGWVSCPVIAVPTSVGYGASFGGVSALLSMLNSCAANICTVNIDAGFKAGYLAGLMT